jgi:OOP family OmpA-OmpF porin
MSKNRKSDDCGLLCAGVWPFIALPLVLLFLTLFFVWQPIEGLVAKSAQNQLSTDYPWAKTSAFHRGRELLLQGLAPDATTVEQAIEVARSVDGVNSVTFVGDIEPVKIVMQPASVSMYVTDGVIKLNGIVGDQKTLERLTEQVNQTFGQKFASTELTVGEHIEPTPELSSVFTALRAMPNSASAKLVDNGLILNGVVSSAEVKANIERQAAEKYRGQINNQIEIVAPPCQLAVNQMLSKTKIYFAVGKASIEPRSDKILRDVAETVKECPEAEFEITGHTDNTGEGEVNENLSSARADAVVRWLANLGLNAERFTVRGAGASEPVADNASAEGRAANRRIEFRVTN